MKLIAKAPRNFRALFYCLSLLAISCTSSSNAPASDVIEATFEPPELAQLSALLGTWEGVTESTVVESGEVFEVRSLRHVRWEADGQVLVEHTLTSAEGARPTTSICIWAWDGSRDAYRSWRFDSHGSIHERLMRWDEEEEAWQMEMTSQLRSESEPSSAKGIMRFTSETEKSYEWTRYKPGSTEPWVVIRGTSTRTSKDAKP